MFKSYRSMRVKDVSTTELLFEILKRGNISEAPMKTIRYGKHFDTVVGIGNDHVAFVTIDDEGLKKLENIIRKENTGLKEKEIILNN